MRNHGCILGRGSMASATLLAALLAGGCAGSSGSLRDEPALGASPGAEADESLAVSLKVSPGQRVAVLRSGVETLRDAGYVVDRADFRQGVLTTEPRAVATALEPWHGATQLRGDAWAATAGQLRRVVRLDFGEVAEAGDAAPLRVRVQLERFEAPNRRLINAAGGRVFSTLSDVPGPWSQAGITASYWRPIGRDLAEEQRLHHAMAQRLP